MIKLYRWLKSKVFKSKFTVLNNKTNFELYCEQNPWARECRIYED